MSKTAYYWYIISPFPTDDRTDNPDNLELVTEDKRIFLVDSGLVLNSPYPILLRPERGVDLYLSFDFSARDKDDEEPFKVRSNDDENLTALVRTKNCAIPLMFYG